MKSFNVAFRKRGESLNVLTSVTVGPHDLFSPPGVWLCHHAGHMERTPSEAEAGNDDHD
jgi:hypothetical protein